MDINFVDCQDFNEFLTNIEKCSDSIDILQNLKRTRMKLNENNNDQLSEGIYHKRRRKANIYRDRSKIVHMIYSKTDSSFKNEFRLSKTTFNELLNSISGLLKVGDKNKHMAFVSSGSYIEMEIQLAVTLRFLAGGCYLDICNVFQIGIVTAYSIFYKVLDAINRSVNNIIFPYNNQLKLREIERGFSNISKGAFKGTVAAGDGVVFQMQKPDYKEVDGNVTSFYSRKGYFAYGMQAFADSKCRFISVSSISCGSTHDATSYAFSAMSKLISEGKLPKWAHIVLDDAYKCTDQELTPWSGKNLSAEKDTFNYFLSLNRQVIERAFGMLVRRWAILKSPLQFKMEHIKLVIIVCCKLHNICIDSNSVVDCDERGRDDIDDVMCQGVEEVVDIYGEVDQGVRRDLELSDRRLRITRRLYDNGYRRPEHSKQMLQSVRGVK